MSDRFFLFLGSSVTYGSAAGGHSFVDLLQEDRNYTCVKLAVSGTTLVDEDDSSYVSRLIQYVEDVKAKTGDVPHPDRLIVQLSTNDATGGKPLGEIACGNDPFDTSTVCGAIEFILSYTKKTMGCPVSFYTGTKYESSRYEQMVDLLHRIARKWGISVLDLWNDEDMNAVSTEDRARFMEDPIHPTLTGYREWWLPKFKDFLAK